MAKFIKLTLFMGPQAGKIRRINIDHVSDYGESNGHNCSFIQIGQIGEDSGYFVRETPEEIDQKIEWVQDEEGRFVE